MTTKTSKKTATKTASKKTTAADGTNAPKTVAGKKVVAVTTAQPSLAELVSGKGEAVAAAVAAKAVKPAAPKAKAGKKESDAIARASVEAAEMEAERQHAAGKKNKKAVEKAAVVGAEAKAEELGAKKKAAKPAKEKAETVASFMRRLITEGKTNEEVFTAAVAKFGIGEEKKHYPSWYRCQLRRSEKVATPAKAAKTSVKTPAKADAKASAAKLKLVHTDAMNH